MTKPQTTQPRNHGSGGLGSRYTALAAVHTNRRGAVGDAPAGVDSAHRVEGLDFGGPR